MNNLAILIGNVGKTPETRQTESGKTLTKFPFATTERYTKDGEKVVNTDWFNIVAFNKLAEIVDKYVKKGAKLAISGKIKTREYQNKEGEKRFITEIIADEIEMLDSKSE